MHARDFRWLNVLLVDDSQPILQYVTEVLAKRFNINCIYAASSAPEALQILKQSHHINLLFLDLNMPDIDGLVLLQQISQLNYGGYIVIMSGVSTKIIASVETLTKQYNLNYLGTLLKPIHESDFDSIINKIDVSLPLNEEKNQLKTYEIIRAIKSDSIEVFYQPQIELVTNTLKSVEARCQINHPSLGMVSSENFIDKAQESELIVHLTIAVLKSSLADWKKWHHYGLNLQLSIKASPIALQQPEFADTVFALLEQFDIPAEHLCIEITERVLAESLLQELTNINRLCMRGVEFALDDFDNKYSTIDRLHKLPITYLKLDKNYFTDKMNNLEMLSIINNNLSTLRKQNIKIIAKGVEDESLLSLITEMGCDMAQGAYIGQPMSAKEVLFWARQWQDKN